MAEKEKKERYDGCREISDPGRSYVGKKKTRWSHSRRVKESM